MIFWSGSSFLNLVDLYLIFDIFFFNLELLVFTNILEYNKSRLFMSIFHLVSQKQKVTWYDGYRGDGNWYSNLMQRVLCMTIGRPFSCINASFVETLIVKFMRPPVVHRMKYFIIYIFLKIIFFYYWNICSVKFSSVELRKRYSRKRIYEILNFKIVGKHHKKSENLKDKIETVTNNI